MCKEYTGDAKKVQNYTGIELQIYRECIEYQRECLQNGIESQWPDSLWRITFGGAAARIRFMRVNLRTLQTFVGSKVVQLKPAPYPLSYFEVYLV